MSYLPNLAFLDIAAPGKRKLDSEDTGPNPQRERHGIQDYLTALDRYDWAVSASPQNGIQWEGSVDVTMGTLTAIRARSVHLQNRTLSQLGGFNIGTKDVPYLNLASDVRKLIRNMNSDIADVGETVFVRWPNTDYMMVDNDDNDVRRYEEREQHNITDELKMTLETAALGLSPRILLAMPAMINDDTNDRLVYYAGGEHPTSRAVVYVFENNNVDLWTVFQSMAIMNDDQILNIAMRIEELIFNISKQGFLLLDNKPTNMVARQRDCNDFFVYAIDIDPQFSHRSRASAPISPVCLEYLNLLTFLVVMYGGDPRDDDRKRAHRFVFHKLLGRLETLLKKLEASTPKEMTFVCYTVLRDPSETPRGRKAYEPGGRMYKVRERISTMLRMDDDYVQMHSVRMTFFMIFSYASSNGLDSLFFAKASESPENTLTKAAVQVLRRMADITRPKIEPEPRRGAWGCAILAHAGW